MAGQSQIVRTFAQPHTGRPPGLRHDPGHICYNSGRIAHLAN